VTSIRPTGIEHAAAALRNIERRQAVLANNLTNVNTTGFKGERVFSRLLDAESTAVADASTDFRPGTLSVTAQPFDLAIQRDGFLVVDTPNGERLTRGGSFSLDESGRLVDDTGNVVLGEQDERGGTRGPVVIPATARDVRIDASGAVIADGTQIARLRMERVPPGTRLTHEGANLFATPSARESIAPGERTLKQGALEDSNVNSVESLVDLISVQRAYASVQKALTTIDSARGISAVELAKPV